MRNFILWETEEPRKIREPIHFISEAEKVASVSKIQFQQKIMEKESLKKMSEIEGAVLA